MADETKQLVTAISMPTPVERPPTGAELRLFAQFQRDIERLERLVQSAGLRLQNIYTAARFATAIGAPVISVSSTEEEQYYALSDTARRLRAAERGVIDWKAGIRLTPNGRDIDIALFPGYELGGIPLIIPALIGVVIVAAAVAACVHAIGEAQEIQRKFNAVMDVADKELCKDPTSEACQKWQVEKLAKNWNQNKTIADSIGSGIEKIAGGLGLGIVIALGIFAWYRSRNR